MTRVRRPSNSRFFSVLTEPKRIRLKCKYTLGDVVVLTAAVRDLHFAYPRVFRTSVETTAPDVWKHNPLISATSYQDEIINCSRIVPDRSGATGRHYLSAYLSLLNQRLGTAAPLTETKGDVHLSEREKNWYSDVWSLCGTEFPFWLICPGGKFDIPLKWWDQRRYQQVVDALRGKIQFVQVGSWGNHHPRLEGVIDLRGKTSVRDLIHLTYYAEGVFCGVTSLMHLAAAVPTQDGRERAAVIVAGAREPASWEAYPHHEFISTASKMECAHCWKSALHGAGPDACLNPRGSLSECMDLISADEVLSRFERLAASGRITFLKRSFQKATRIAIRSASETNFFEKDNITPLNAPAKTEEFVAAIPRYPARRFSGRGIVICGGGLRYFPCAWVNIRILRKLGCTLPIELWHLGRHEMDRRMEALLAPFDVRCVNAREVMNRYPMRNPNGWELKAYAMLHCGFREVLSLDADNVALTDPSFLFEEPEYRRTGAIFWPDYGRLAPQRRIWRLSGIAYRDEPEFESGQMVVNKEMCWRAVNLAWWYNDHSEFFYRYVHGDKETFHLAWRKLAQPYGMPPFPIHSLEGTMCQHDFNGRRIFQHRNTPKWLFFGQNQRLKDFLLESECLEFLEELKAEWNGKIRGRAIYEKKHGWTFRKDAVDEDVFESVALGNEYRLPRRFDPSAVIIDVGAHIGSFAFACHVRGSGRILSFEPNADNYALAKKNIGHLPGVFLERAAVLGCKGYVECEPFPGLNGVQNTGGGKIIPKKRSEIMARSINSLLCQEGNVALLKLDCEGSEWPIIFGCTEWARLGAVCGEYHLVDSFARSFGIRKALDPGLLFDTLRREFSVVIVEQPKGEGLGRFWASRKSNFFARAAGNISIFGEKAS